MLPLGVAGHGEWRVPPQYCSGESHPGNHISHLAAGRPEQTAVDCGITQAPLRSSRKTKNRKLFSTQDLGSDCMGATCGSSAEAQGDHRQSTWSLNASFHAWVKWIHPSAHSQTWFFLHFSAFLRSNLEAGPQGICREASVPGRWHFDLGIQHPEWVGS